MISENIDCIRKQLPENVKLVAVSKFHPLEKILEACGAGQNCFGESRPQEFSAKAVQIPQDVEWHFIGHLQTNKLKLVLPYAAMVESVDSRHLLSAIDDWAGNNGKTVDVLLEMHIGAEQTKQGFHEEEILELMWDLSDGKFKNVRVCGLMGMATHTDCEDDIRADFGRISAFFEYLRDLFPELECFRELSIGMSDDWKIALEYGATIVRIGTSIFGSREY